MAFKAWITEILANPSLVTRAVEEGLYQLGYESIKSEQLTAVESLLAVYGFALLLARGSWR